MEINGSEERWVRTEEKEEEAEMVTVEGYQ